MKLIINLFAVLIAVSVQAQTAGTNQTVEAELRNSACVQNRHVWNVGFTEYLAVHEIYVCKVLQPPDPNDYFKRCQLQIDRTIRGERTGKLRCELPGATNEVKAGMQVIVLGNDQKSLFSVIGWWFHSEKTEKAIGALTKPTVAPRPHGPHPGHPDGQP
jgi:hypothetical protein